jgi:hypothetical protein
LVCRLVFAVHGGERPLELLWGPGVVEV